MKEMVHIIGHKNPDTDSIVSALAYAELKNKLHIPAIACRIGDINPETSYVLEKFQVEAPVYIENAKVKLYDIIFDEAMIVRKGATLKEAWDRMRVSKTKSVYVSNEENQLLGIVSLSDITSILMNEKKKHQELMKHTPYENICKVVDGTMLYAGKSYRPSGIVQVRSSYKKYEEEIDDRDCIAIVGSDLKMQKQMIERGAQCIILVEVDIVSQSMLRCAKEHDCTIIHSSMDMLSVARNIYKAPSVDLIMQRKVVAVYNHEYIDDVYQKMSKSRFRSYPVLNHQGKILGSIARFHLLNYQRKKFILVDHNEISQSIDNLKEGEVLEIVDHHRIGDVETTTPIIFRNEIIGSTASIIYKLYKENGIEPSKKIAAVMCCAIISDTMNFNSPTTTRIDREIAEELAKLANIHLDTLAKDMFAAVATIQGRTHSEILYNDFKEYQIHRKRIAIGQINIANEQEVAIIKEPFLSYMETINSINTFDLLMMCFTDVEGRGSNLLFIGPLAYLVDEAFKEEIIDDLYFVDGILSRKKQIIPKLAKVIEAN